VGAREARPPTNGDTLIFRKRHPSPADFAGALRRLARVAILRGDTAEAAALDAAATQTLALSPKALTLALTDPERGFDALVAPHVTALAADPAGVAWAAEARLPRDLAGLARSAAFDLAALAGTRIHVAADLLGAFHDRPAAELDAVLAAMRADQTRVALGRALAAADALIDVVGRVQPTLTLHVAGGLRRFEVTVGDILLLATGERAEAAVEAWADSLQSGAVRARSTGAATFAWEGEEVTIRAVAGEALGAALIHYTGSRAHVAQLAARAAARGVRLTPAGLTGADGRSIPTSTEADLYAALELPWIPPERRHGLDEIALAERGALGTPLALADIQGDLHTHTHWSDGRDTTETVIRSARLLGYRYVAITDHSPSSKASRSLTIAGLADQGREIATLRERYPDITILHGCEVDILEDGGLDLPEALMEGLDIVLASLHDSFGQPPERLLDRYLGAMAHPLISVITHPANRAPGRTSGYALDWERFFAAAHDSGTAVEVDGAPGHLDLDGHLARQAVERSATLVVDSDGHFAERLGRQMRMGVGMAARGGVEARHVLNTRDVDGVRSFVAAKRRRAG
jgi:DNA polymerase (family 10)